MNRKINDVVSSISHLCGAIASIPITIGLIIYGVYYGEVYSIISYIIFGLSLLALYTASTVYHLIPTNIDYSIAKLRARKIDHMMIYVLIAGSYTPVCLISLHGKIGYIIIAIIWSIAIAGIIFKLFVVSDKKIVRYISTSFYVFMGWLIIFAVYPLVKSMNTISFIFLVLGGVSYTVGAVIYALKKPHINIEWLSFHDIFHFFVLLGSMFHVFMMFTLH